MSSWIGFDLDHTLAEYDSGYWHANYIGRPILPMLNLLRAIRAAGIEVRIVTARVNAQAPDPEAACHAIEHWCREHVGEVLPVTNQKDYEMLLLFDDRAIQVKPNSGELVGELPSWLTQRLLWA